MIENSLLGEDEDTLPILEQEEDFSFNVALTSEPSSYISATPKPQSRKARKPKRVTL